MMSRSKLLEGLKCRNLLVSFSTLAIRVTYEYMYSVTLILANLNFDQHQNGYKTEFFMSWSGLPDIRLNVIGLGRVRCSTCYAY
jgi:hypothetical protein